MPEVRPIDANDLMFDVMSLTIVSPEVMNYANAVAVAIDNAPTIDAVPVVHANNVTPTHLTDMFVCGSCGFTCEITKLIYEDEDYPEVGIPIAFEYDCKYCPDCGAKMDAKEDDNA